MKKKELIEKFFVKKTIKCKFQPDIIVDEINKSLDLKLNFKNDQQAAQFLVELIRRYMPETQNFHLMFPVDSSSNMGKKEDEWRFFFCCTQSCCDMAHEIMDIIFGDWEKSYNFCFVIDERKGNGSGGYVIDFKALKHFAYNCPSCPCCKQTKRE